jgi:hypothetical protein
VVQGQLSYTPKKPLGEEIFELFKYLNGNAVHIVQHMTSVTANQIHYTHTGEDAPASGAEKRTIFAASLMCDQLVEADA